MIEKNNLVEFLEFEESCYRKSYEQYRHPSLIFGSAIFNMIKQKILDGNFDKMEANDEK